MGDKQFLTKVNKEVKSAVSKPKSSVKGDVGEMQLDSFVDESANSRNSIKPTGLGNRKGVETDGESTMNISSRGLNKMITGRHSDTQSGSNFENVGVGDNEDGKGVGIETAWCPAQKVTTIRKLNGVLDRWIEHSQGGSTGSKVQSCSGPKIHLAEKYVEIGCCVS
ncbi:hypothetical protein Ancab_025244 [Ancistrocladus abbreviatus]